MYEWKMNIYVRCVVFYLILYNELQLKQLIFTLFNLLSVKHVYTYWQKEQIGSNMIFLIWESENKVRKFVNEGFIFLN